MFNYYIWGSGPAGGNSSGGDSGGSGVTSINNATGDIMFAGVSGIFIERQGNTIYVAHSGITIDLTASGFLTNASFAGDREATWYFAEYNSDNISFDHAFFLRQRSQISDVVLYGNSPSGNFIASLASGWPGQNPTAMYVGNSKPTISGIRQVSSGLLPDTIILEAGSILYANIESIPAATSGVRFSVYFDMDTIMSGIQSGVMTINSTATGPNVLITGQTGVEVTSVGNQIFINTSGLPTVSQLQQSGYATLSEVRSDMHASGYVRNTDLLGSGYVRSINGLSNQVSLVGSGGTLIWVDGQTVQIYSSGGGGITLAEVRDDIRTSGYVRHTDMLVSGYARLTDLLASGFKPESATDHGALLGLTDDDHPQYILNTAFISSGFITKAEVAQSGFAHRSQISASGYLRVVDQLYPVDARAVSGHMIPNTSGAWDLGSTTKYMKDIYVDRVHAQSGLSISGVESVYSEIKAGRGIESIASVGNDIYINTSGYVNTIQGLSGVVTLVGSGSTTVWKDGQTIQISASGSTVYDEKEWNASGPLEITSGFDGGRFIKYACEIVDISCWSRTPSGNVIFGLSSGAPGYTPRSLYTTNSKPITSGDYACVSGSLPNTTTIGAGTLLYADIHQVPSGVNALTASGACVQVFLRRL